MEAVNATDWYAEATVATIGFLLGVFVLIVICRELTKAADDEVISLNDIPLPMKVSIILFYVVFGIMMLCHVLRLFILPFIFDNNHTLEPWAVCSVMFKTLMAISTTFQVALSNLLLEKLLIAFTNSMWAVNERVNYALRILALLFWGFVWILLLGHDGMAPVYSPIGIYCGRVTTSTRRAYIHILVVVGIFLQLVLFWITFSWKLCSLLKHFKHRCVNAPMLEMMRTQNMSLATMLISFIVCFTISMFGIGGRAFPILALILQAVCIFFTISFGRIYYKKLRCRRLEECCCDSIEEAMLEQMGWTEKDETGQPIEDTIAKRFENSLRRNSTISTATRGEFAE